MLERTFRHAKGHSGAVGKSADSFKKRRRHTILDEIDMNVAIQAKLLRVIQERKVRPRQRSHDINVRIVAVTQT